MIKKAALSKYVFYLRSSSLVSTHFQLPILDAVGRTQTCCGLYSVLPCLIMLSSNLSLKFNIIIK